MVSFGVAIMSFEEFLGGLLFVGVFIWIGKQRMGTREQRSNVFAKVMLFIAAFIAFATVLGILGYGK